MPARTGPELVLVVVPVIVFLFFLFGRDNFADVVDLTLQLLDGFLQLRILGLQVFEFGFQFLSALYSSWHDASPSGIFDDLEALLVGVLPCAQTVDPVCVLISAEIVQAGDGPASGGLRLR